MKRTPHLTRTIPDDGDELYRPPARRERLTHAFRRLDGSEVRFVRAAVGRCKGRPRLHALNRFLNLMGNGWLYLPLAVLPPLVKGRGSWRFMASAALSVVVAHFFYPLIKLRLARMRPYDFDPTLGSDIKALDKYSCPSGHCMTAAAVGIPLALAFPATLPAMGLIWVLVAWSRISLGHHYPTDLLLGGLIGAVIAVPVSMWIL
jgi:undecaprenyl-diphosphatase